MAVKSQNEYNYAIRTYLETETGVDTVQIYDGVKLPTVKPFLTVEALQNQLESIGKLRESFEKTMRYQVGVHATSSGHRAQLQDIIEELFLFGDIALYESPGAEPSGYFHVSVDNATPIPSDDITDETNRHLLYFDISVTDVLHKNQGGI